MPLPPACGATRRVAMAEGALEASAAVLSIAITGIAGPDGGSAEKPVGLVFIATSYNGKTEVHKLISDIPQLI